MSHKEKFTASIGDGSIVMLGLDLNGKGVFVKVGSGVSVVRKTNNDSGRGCGSEGTRSGISKRSEKNGAEASDGGDCGGGVDETVRQKNCKTEKELKVMIVLSKLQK
ncbi:uncharacterized protein MONOS_12721 [Monocercomonoides exilis]|uniref:uncharacterized protein n=1 Tax=Monocercomonoides exilis TaxID=2049356 RepID=UPI00355AAA10|nr:hypothetical protein MONOS_12721 [Monocercomonoides exilis]|eukprot:MONOS_12721.1-p1 / transcript=MONOS_12721.1 / gene=MONOS_12721 / organism=Monocercomonoides_exilis_PA203 / gene_product=unspecified product / transcript_product=unspecified product / location=Mono_scaffold00724:29634-30016(+) / protein_length=107 / sequence_SO=supercontig / SO=protein_coding / is_pseudo=false